MDLISPAAVQTSARQASLVWSPHPLLAAEGRVVVFDPPTGGESLHAYLTRLGVDLSGPVIVAVDRTVIPREWLHRVKPKPGTLITVRAAVAGGDGSQVVAMVAMIALMIAAPYLGMALATGMTGSSIAATTFIAGTTLTPAMIGTAVVTVAGSMLVSALVPRPKVDLGRAMSTAKDSPTYSLAGGSNQARPYEPLALTLGTHRVYFDLASRPYTVNVGDDQYLYQVFHVGLRGGQGPLRVADLRIGDTPLSDYSGVVTQYTEDAMPTLMPYNVDTLAGASVSVAGGPVTRTTSIDTTRIELDLQLILFYTGDTGLIGRAVDVKLEYRAVGSATWLPIGDAPSYGYYTHYWSLGYTYTPLAGMGDPYWKQTAYDGNRSPAAHVDGVGGWWWRPYAERPVSDPAPPDYLTDSSAVLHIIGASATPIRRTYGIDVAKGQYEIRVTRVSPDETDSRATSDISLVAVKSYQSQAGSFTGQTFLAVKILASGQLNGTVATLSGVVSQPIAPGEYSSNPADLFLLYARGYRMGGRLLWGAGLQDSEIDLASVNAWRTYCNTKALTCNIHIDSAKSVWDILQAITRCGRGSPSWATGNLGVLWDAASLPVIAVFGPSNIKQGSFEVVYGSEAAADEITLTYINAANNWQTDTIRVLAPGVTTPKKPAALELWGVTNRDQAVRECRLQAAQQAYRSRMVSWVTDMEGLVVTRGDVVMLSHDMTQWGMSGRLVGGSTTVLQLDRSITLNAAGSWITVVSPDGTMTTCRVQYVAGEVASVTLLDPLPSAPDADHPIDWRWVADYKATPGKRLKITDIKPASMTEVRITAMDDPDEYYAYESGAYTPPAVTPWTSSDPVITGLRFAEELVPAGAGYSVVLIATWSEKGGIATRRVRYQVNGGPWIDLGLVDGSSVRIDVPSSGTVNVAVLGYDGAGRVPASAKVSGSRNIVGRYTLPPAVTGFGVSTAADGTRVLTWAVDAVSADVGYIEIRCAASSSTAWASMGSGAVVLYKAGRFETSLPAAGTWTFEARMLDGAGGYSAIGTRVTVTLGSAPVAITNTNQLTDGAGLGATATWSGVTGSGKPLDNSGKVIDGGTGTGPGQRQSNDPPSYYPVGKTQQFKWSSAVGIPDGGTWVSLETNKQYADNSGGMVTQWAYGQSGATWKRCGFPADAAWGGWTQDLDRNTYTGDLNATWGANASNLNVGIGTNLLANTEFIGTVAPAVMGWNPGGCAALYLVTSGSWIPVGCRGIQSYLAGRSGNAYNVGCDVYLTGGYAQAAYGLPVVAGRRYEFSAKVASHRCDVALCIDFFDKDNVQCGGTGAPWVARNSGGNALSANANGTGFGHAVVFGTAPSNAVYASIYWRRSDTDVGQADSYAWLTQPLFGEAGAAQAVPSTYSPGYAKGALSGVDAIGPGNSSQYVQDGAFGTTQLAAQAATSVMQASSATYLGIVAGATTAIGYFDLLDDAKTGAVVAMTSCGMFWPQGATEIFCSITAIPGTPSGPGLGLPWGVEYVLVSEFSVAKFSLADEQGYSVSTSFVLPAVQNIRIFVKFRAPGAFLKVKQSTRIEVIKR